MAGQLSIEEKVKIVRLYSAQGGCSLATRKVLYQGLLFLGGHEGQSLRFKVHRFGRIKGGDQEGSSHVRSGYGTVEKSML